jgi:hypothetical protein
MPIARKHLPSPLIGEGAGGGGSRASSPPSPPSPARGEGVLTSPCEPVSVPWAASRLSGCGEARSVVGIRRELHGEGGCSARVVARHTRARAVRHTTGLERAVMWDCRGTQGDGGEWKGCPPRADDATAR